MTPYAAALTGAMTDFARDPRACFIGYGIRHGRALGTLRDVPEPQLIEMPVAENLMVGFATGLALMGRRPLVFIERCDFLLHALDAIVNHLDKIAAISAGEFRPAVILRIVVGNTRVPKFTGPTHTQNFATALRAMVSFPVIELDDLHDPAREYAQAAALLDTGTSTALLEFKDLH